MCVSVLLALMMWSVTVESASAQSIYGSIRGLVTDPSDAAVAGAKVSLVKQGTGELRTTLSNSLGEYAFSQLVVCRGAGAGQ